MRFRDTKTGKLIGGITHDLVHVTSGISGHIQLWEKYISEGKLIISGDEVAVERFHKGMSRIRERCKEGDKLIDLLYEESKKIVEEYENNI